MKVAIMGGTFNPLHIGHLILADEVRVELGCQIIVFVPLFHPAHKPPVPKPSPEQRIEMLQLSLQNVPWARVSDCELSRKGISYSIDTVLDVKKEFGLKEKPGFIVGDDLLESFPLWKKIDELCEQAHIIVAHRLSAQPIPTTYPHLYVNNTIIPLSSSQIRERVRAKKAYRFLVPSAVATYIQEKGLYES